MRPGVWTCTLYKSIDISANPDVTVLSDGTCVTNYTRIVPSQVRKVKIPARSFEAVSEDTFTFAIDTSLEDPHLLAPGENYNAPMWYEAGSTITAVHQSGQTLTASFDGKTTNGQTTAFATMRPGT